MAYDERKISTQKAHTLSLDDRKNLKLSGIERVDSFDENEIILVTGGGELAVRGEGLHMDGLDLETGEAAVTGKISELVYSESRPREGFLSRLFR